jgi:hypothetical protein
VSVRKRGDKWYYDFMVCHTRYRGIRPEALNKAQAQKAGAKTRLDVYDGLTSENHCSRVKFLREDNKRIRYLTEAEEAYGRHANGGRRCRCLHHRRHTRPRHTPDGPRYTHATDAGKRKVIEVFSKHRQESCHKIITSIVKYPVAVNA